MFFSPRPKDSRKEIEPIMTKLNDLASPCGKKKIKSNLCHAIYVQNIVEVLDMRKRMVLGPKTNLCHAIYGKNSRSAGYAKKEGLGTKKNLCCPDWQWSLSSYPESSKKHDDGPLWTKPFRALKKITDIRSWVTSSASPEASKMGRGGGRVERGKRIFVGGAQASFVRQGNCNASRLSFVAKQKKLERISSSPLVAWKNSPRETYIIKLRN